MNFKKMLALTVLAVCGVGIGSAAEKKIMSVADCDSLMAARSEKADDSVRACGAEDSSFREIQRNSNRCRRLTWSFSKKSFPRC